MTKTQLLTPVIAIFAFAVVFSACSAQQSATQVTPTVAPVAETTTMEATPMIVEDASAAAAENLVVDGRSISQMGKYTSPAGEETIRFSIVLDETGVITQAKAEPQATNPTSKIRQAAFAEGFSGAITGKKLADLSNVDRIGGSSLTTKALNEFLTKAKTQL